MLRNSAKTAVLLAALGGVMVGVGSLSGLGGAVVGLGLGLAVVGFSRRVSCQNLFRTHPTTQQRVARLRGQRV